MVMSCKLCGSLDSCCISESLIGEVEPYSKFLDGPFPIKTTLQMCKQCSTIWREPLYKEDEMRKLYSLYLANSGEDELIGNHIKRGENNFKLLHPIFASGKPTVKGAKILDVGGKRGEFLDNFLRAGYEGHVIDLSPANPITSSIKKFNSSFLQFNELIQFDIIMMSHVLEHLPNPLVFLNHAYKLLKTQGIIFIEVPLEIHIPAIRSQGDFRHLYFFTKYTLKRFLLNSGFSILKCYMAYDTIGVSKIPVIKAIGIKGIEAPDIKSISFCFSKLFLMLEMLNPLPWFYRVRNKVIQRN
jgi:SAM-dependent methyltransferase